MISSYPDDHNNSHVTSWKKSHSLPRDHSCPEFVSNPDDTSPWPDWLAIRLAVTAQTDESTHLVLPPTITPTSPSSKSSSIASPSAVERFSNHIIYAESQRNYPRTENTTSAINMSFQDKAQHQISQIDKEVCAHMSGSLRSSSW